MNFYPALFDGALLFLVAAVVLLDSIAHFIPARWKKRPVSEALDT